MISCVSLGAPALSNALCIIIQIQLQQSYMLYNNNNNNKNNNDNNNLYS